MCIYIFTQVIYPVIRAGNFEGGGSHVSDLMELTLSGIDANDLPKTWATLRFYTGAMTHSYFCRDYSYLCHV